MQTRDAIREHAHLEAEQRAAKKTLLNTNPTLERLKARSRGHAPGVPAQVSAGLRPKPIVR